MTRYRLADPDPELTALHLRLFREIERRGDLGGLWAALDDPDEESARRAWWRLADLATELDVDEAAWERLLRWAGWEPAGPDEERP